MTILPLLPETSLAWTQHCRSNAKQGAVDGWDDDFGDDWEDSSPAQQVGKGGEAQS